MEIDAWLYQMVANVKKHPSKSLCKVISILNDVIENYLKIGHGDSMHVITKLFIRKDGIDANARKTF